MSFANINFQNGTFATGAVVVNDAVNYVEVCALAPTTRMQGCPVTGDWYITGTVGAAALQGFKVTAAPAIGGNHVDLLVDGDFNSQSALLVSASTSVHLSGAGITFFIILRNMRSFPEVKFWAKGPATTLSLQGSMR